MSKGTAGIEQPEETKSASLIVYENDTEHDKDGLGCRACGGDKRPGITFTNLYNFSVDAFSSGNNPVATNSDGINPMGMVVAGNVIYGTAFYGGPQGDGTLFRVNSDGTHFTNLFSFNLGTFDPTSSTYPNSTGASPKRGFAAHQQYSVRHDVLRGLA